MARPISIVLITFNSERFLRRCLSGALAQTFQPLNLIVIDNASEDGSVRTVERLMPRATILKNARNTGFSAAANQGIAAAGTDDVLLLNPDAFITPDYVQQVARAIDRAGERFGSAAGKLLRAEGDEIRPTSVIDSAGIRMTRSGRHFDRGAGEADGAPTASEEVFGVSAAAALYRREFLDDVAIDGDPFDEDFFAFREDADIAWRGRLFGWSALYVPEAVGYHVRTVTPETRGSLPPEINMHSVKNRFLLRLKNQSAYLALRNLPFELFRDLVVLLGTLTVEQSSLPAWRWLWKHRAEIRATRREIQRRRKVSDRDLAHWFR